MRICPKCGEQIEEQFDSCWKCAAEPKPVIAPAKRLTWSYFILAGIMSVLAVMLADILQYLLIADRGYGLYQAILWQAWGEKPSGMGYEYFTVIRAILSFLILWCLVKFGFRSRLIWICLVGGWMVVDILLQPAAIS